MHVALPSPSDRCAWMLLFRALDELRDANHPDVKHAKADALAILLRYGWRDVFRESLIHDKFKSYEEAGRFNFCTDVWLSPTTNITTPKTTLSESDSKFSNFEKS